MEVRIDGNDAVIEWLASMGYPVKGMPPRLLRGMLLREARQWNVSPEALEALIYEGARSRGTAAGDGAPAMQPEPNRVQPRPEPDAYADRERNDRLTGMHH